MKYLILLMALTLFGCSDGSNPVLSAPATLKFTAGAEITQTVGFYSNCIGYITGYFLYKDPGQPDRYAVSFNCPNIGRLKGDVIISEDKMKLYRKKN